MSVNCTNYLVFGIKITNQEQIEKFNDIVSEYDGDLDRMLEQYTKELNAIYDGMCGDYLVIGKILSECDNIDEVIYSHDVKDFDDFHYDISEVYDKLFSETLPVLPKLLHFNH